MNQRTLVTLFVLGSSSISSVALAQGTEGPPPPTPPGGDASAPVPQPTTSLPMGMEPPPGQQKDGGATDPNAKPKKKEPGRGDFDAGGQVRLPSGPDETGMEYGTFNWIAFDMKGRYFLLDQVTLNGNIPLAVKKPDMLADGSDPRLIGGMTVRMDAKMKAPKFGPIKNDAEVGLSLTGAYMREGAMLLSEKDYPLFVGDFKPGFAGALITKVKLSTLVDFSLVPAWVYQSGTMESLTAVQIPMSLIVKLGDAVKVSTDVGIFTGDDYSFSGSNGGRIAAGGSLDLKIGPILAHAGAGVASLLTGGLYPSIGDSVYIDLNVKYAK